jgi:type II secretory ATPase GspE/PulE/Tfp pilus assembly ATPase PilB-like protein
VELTPAAEAAIEGSIDEGVTLYEGKGCSRCRATGYAGRLGIHELLSPKGRMLELVSQEASLQELRSEAESNGHRTLKFDGFTKAQAGLTTVEEVLRVSAL